VSGKEISKGWLTCETDVGGNPPVTRYSGSLVVHIVTQSQDSRLHTEHS
jgi:hypothetical protein